MNSSLSLHSVSLPLHIKHSAGEPGGVQKTSQKKEKTDAPSGGGRYSITPTALRTLISRTGDPFSSNGPSLSHLRTPTFVLLCLQRDEGLSSGSEQVLELISNPVEQKNDSTRESISSANLMRHRHRGGPAYKQIRPQLNFNLIEIME